MARCLDLMGGAMGLAWWVATNVWLWFMVNRKVIRPFFGYLNTKAFDGWRCPLPRDGHRNTTTGLEVIVASPDGTGTTTLNFMLGRLGLRTYHTEEVLFYFEDFVNAYSQQRAGLAELVGPIKACGVRALCVNPLLELTPVLVRASPGVKILFGKRDWKSWQRSGKIKKEQFGFVWFELGLNLLMCHLLPYGFFWPAPLVDHHAFGTNLTSLMLNQCLTYGSIRGMIAMGRFHKRSKGGVMVDRQAAMEDNETAYQQYLEDVRALVPPERFLHFDHRYHGWTELARFIGQPAPLGMPVPRLKVRSFSPTAVALQLCPASLAAFWSLLLLAAAINWAAFRLCLRCVQDCSGCALRGCRGAGKQE